MEFNCPDCGKRLRAPDHLKNPLVRCRSCGATFRPVRDVSSASTGTPPAIPARQSSRPLDPTAERPFSAPPIPPVAPGPWPAKRTGQGWGIAGIVLLILLAKAPRLVRWLFPPERQPPAVPAHINDEQWENRKQMLEEARRKQALRHDQEAARQDAAPADAGKIENAVLLDLIYSITGLEAASVCADLKTVFPICRWPKGGVDTFSGKGAANDFLAPPTYLTFADGHREILLCDVVLQSHHRQQCVAVNGGTAS